MPLAQDAWSYYQYTSGPSKLASNQLIHLKPNQIEAIANHLEQVAIELREAIAKANPISIWVNDVQHIETLLGSADSFVREVNRSLERNHLEDEPTQVRTGRPRRTRRRKP